MSLPGSGSEPSLIVADASVWISLTASGRLEDVVDGIGAPIAIADIALNELERGRAKGHDAPHRVSALVGAARVLSLCLTAADEQTFLSLVAGPTVETLDDGEAATLALALRLGAVAVIDERKATAIAARRFPALQVRSTTDLLFAALPHENEGQGPLADALFAALQGARMRVPQHWLERVANTLGTKRLRLCQSLPASLRNPRAPDVTLVGA
jgi:predicted nucleic acid-binding protein